MTVQHKKSYGRFPYALLRVRLEYQGELGAQLPFVSAFQRSLSIETVLNSKLI